MFSGAENNSLAIIIIYATRNSWLFVLKPKNIKYKAQNTNLTVFMLWVFGILCFVCILVPVLYALLLYC